MYIEELQKKGIENEFTEPLDEKKTVFIKLHGTLPFLYRYCNKLSINLPLKGIIMLYSVFFFTFIDGLRPLLSTQIEPLSTIIYLAKQPYKINNAAKCTTSKENF